MLGAAHGEQGHDVASSKATPNGSRIVAAIPEHTVWSLSRSAPCALQRGNRIDQRQGFLRVVPIRAGQANRERHALSVADQMALAPALGPIGGIRTRLFTAVHRAYGQLSTTARDQSIWSSHASQSRSAKWIRSHTPASCQSRRRRQHVIPDPHSSSCGSSGRRCLPATRTNTRCRIVAELWSFENIKGFVQAQIGLAIGPKITVDRAPGRHARADPVARTEHAASNADDLPRASVGRGPRADPDGARFQLGIGIGHEHRLAQAARLNE